MSTQHKVLVLDEPRHGFRYIDKAKNKTNTPAYLVNGCSVTVQWIVLFDSPLLYLYFTAEKEYVGVIKALLYREEEVYSASGCFQGNIMTVEEYNDWQFSQK